MYNGVIMTMYCPPMNRLFETPRQSTIDDVVAKYPEQKKKSVMGMGMPSMPNMKTLGDGMSAIGQSIKNAKNAAATKKGWW